MMDLRDFFFSKKPLLFRNGPLQKGEQYCNLGADKHQKGK